MGLFGALGSRYKLRRKFVNDMVHMLEIAPFVMMGESVRVRTLADYLMADEIPDQIDQKQLRNKINIALERPNGENGEVAYRLLVSSVPMLTTAPIRWVEWLDEQNRDRLAKAYMDEANQELN